MPGGVSSCLWEHFLLIFPSSVRLKGTFNLKMTRWFSHQSKKLFQHRKFHRIGMDVIVMDARRCFFISVETRLVCTDQQLHRWQESGSDMQEKGPRQGLEPWCRFSKYSTFYRILCCCFYLVLKKKKKKKKFILNNCIFTYLGYYFIFINYYLTYFILLTVQSI